MTVLSVPIWDSDEQAEFTVNFVERCLALTSDPFLLVVVDNASPAKTTQNFLASLQDPRVRIIHNTENKGYAYAANQGIYYGMATGCEYGIILNNDIEILTPDWISTGFTNPLRSFDNCVLIGARLIDFNELTRFRMPPEPYADIVPYLEGWALGFHRNFVAQVGLFDENIFAWYEDVDLTLRAKYGGYLPIQSPAFEWNKNESWPRKSVLLHYYGRTGFRKLDFRQVSQKSREYFLQKWEITEPILK